MDHEKSRKAYRLDEADRVVGLIFTVLTWLSILAVFYIMMNTFINVISRVVFSHSINGSVQTTQATLSLVALCALPIVTMYNTHIKVDLIAEKLPPKAQNILACFNLLLCSVMMLITSYFTFLKAAKVKALGTCSDIPRIPYWPIYDLIAVMMIVSAICALYNLFHFILAGTTIHPGSFAEVKKRILDARNRKGEHEG